MNLDDMKKKYLNKQFLTYYAFVFVFLYVFFSLIRFLGQLPILLIITFFVTYYITYNSENSTIYENKSLLNLSSYFTASNESNNTSSKGTNAGTGAGIGTSSKMPSEPEIIIGNNSVSNKSSLGYRSFS
jgi:hypothetical protein